MRCLFAVLLFLVAGCSKPRGSIAEFRELCSRQYPTNRTINIVFHGHSVPAGYFKTPDVRTFDAYPHLVHRALKERFTNATINVIIAARGGETSTQGERRMREVMSHAPDLLVIDYALNDRRAGLEKSGKAWRAMIRAGAARCPVLVLTASPDTDERTDALRNVSAQLRSIAREEGAVLVDVAAVFATLPAVDKLMASHNHPNDEGHKVIAAAIVAELIR